MRPFARINLSSVALRMLILVSSLALALAGSGGCISIKLDGEVRKNVSSWTGFEDGIEEVSFDAIEPLVTTNGAGCWVSFYAVGDFVVNDGKVVEMAYDKYMAIGILPLFAKQLEHDGAGFYMAAAIATIPKKPQEICSQLNYKDWLCKKFTVPVDKTKFGSDKME